MDYLYGFISGCVFSSLYFVLNRKSRKQLLKRLFQSQCWKFFFYKESYSCSYRSGYESYTMGSDDGLLWLLLRKDFSRIKINCMTQCRILKYHF